jgi:hypothetical protein
MKIFNTFLRAFCFLYFVFKQFDAFEKVFSKCFNKFDVHSFIISNIRPLRGGGGGGEGVDRWQGNYHYSTQLNRTKDER